MSELSLTPLGGVTSASKICNGYPMKPYMSFSNVSRIISLVGVGLYGYSSSLGSYSKSLINYSLV